MMRRTGKKRKITLLPCIKWIIVISLISIASVYFLAFLLGPPSLTKEENTIYYNRNNEVIGVEQGIENRFWIDLEAMPSMLIEATLAVEDKNFYSHYGFDIKRIGKAILRNIQTLSLKEGASTLTQQYARNLYLTHEKTWSRKLKEAFYTIRLEMFYTKDEILEGYLNEIYYGHGAYGIEAASRTFFDKHVDELSLAEIAMLVGIPKGPTYYSPLNDIDNATSRQHTILTLLKDEKIINEAEYVTAKQEELVYANPQRESTDGNAPYYRDFALKEASRILRLPVDQIETGGYHIFTTLDNKAQKQLESKIEETVNDESELEIGAMAMDPKTGAVTALVGGRSYNKSPFNRAVSAKRMTGSTFKPFLYYTALQHGYTPTTMLMSKPTVFQLEDGQTYQPSNYNDYYAYEPITLAQALAVSDNIYAVKTNIFLGPDKLVDTAKQFGITADLPAVPSLALGTVSVSLNEMVRAYGMLANGGREVNSYAIEKIIDRHGKTVYERNQSYGEQVLDRQTAFILTDLMTGMFDQSWNGYMEVTGSTIASKLSRTYAGKSGSTNSDSWMIGFSPSMVAGVWIGYDDNRPLEYAFEAAYAKDIWASFMEAIHQERDVEQFIAPEGVVRANIDPKTGQLATPYCPEQQSVYFEEGKKPTTHCTAHFHQDEVPEDDEELEEEKGLLERLIDIFS